MERCLLLLEGEKTENKKPTLKIIGYILPQITLVLKVKGVYKT
jgi:hypothetical protein